MQERQTQVAPPPLGYDNRRIGEGLQISLQRYSEGAWELCQGPVLVQYI